MCALSFFLAYVTSFFFVYYIRCIDVAEHFYFTSYFWLNWFVPDSLHVSFDCSIKMHRRCCISCNRVAYRPKYATCCRGCQHTHAPDCRTRQNMLKWLRRRLRRRYALEVCDGCDAAFPCGPTFRQCCRACAEGEHTLPCEVRQRFCHWNLYVDLIEIVCDLWISFATSVFLRLTPQWRVLGFLLFLFVFFSQRASFTFMTCILHTQFISPCLQGLARRNKNVAHLLTQMSN